MSKLGHPTQLKYKTKAETSKNPIPIAFFIFISNFFLWTWIVWYRPFTSLTKIIIAEVSFKNKLFCLSGLYLGLSGLIVKIKENQSTNPKILASIESSIKLYVEFIKNYTIIFNNFIYFYSLTMIIKSSYPFILFTYIMFIKNLIDVFTYHTSYRLYLIK